ncbi:hypothetical protein VNO77_19542 [Canavalia gladiata]|uniref:Uncharacterized protein n=1 Tax=Canavalia gladiata TaxID=3824 RepID=A0AAN9LRH7_CANGL
MLPNIGAAAGDPSHSSSSSTSVTARHHQTLPDFVRLVFSGVSDADRTSARSLLHAYTPGAFSNLVLVHSAIGGLDSDLQGTIQFQTRLTTDRLLRPLHGRILFCQSLS